jgi:hypothetical protein
MFVNRDEDGKIKSMFKWSNDSTTEELTENEFQAEIDSGNAVPSLLEDYG